MLPEPDIGGNGAAQAHSSRCWAALLTKTEAHSTFSLYETDWLYCVTRAIDTIDVMYGE